MHSLMIFCLALCTQDIRLSKSFSAAGAPYKYWGSPSTMNELLEDMASHQVDSSCRTNCHVLSHLHVTSEFRITIICFQPYTLNAET